METEVDFPAVMQRMRRAIATVGEHDDPERFRRLGVKLYVGGNARFDSPVEMIALLGSWTRYGLSAAFGAAK